MTLSRKPAKVNLDTQIVFVALTNSGQLVHIEMLINGRRVVTEGPLRDERGNIMAKCKHCGGRIEYNRYVISREDVYHIECLESIRKAKRAEKKLRQSTKKEDDETKSSGEPQPESGDFADDREAS